LQPLDHPIVAAASAQGDRRRMATQTITSLGCRRIAGRIGRWALVVGMLLLPAAHAAAADREAVLRLMGFDRGERQALMRGERSLAGLRLEMALRLAGCDRAAAAQRAGRYETERGKAPQSEGRLTERLPLSARRFWPLVAPLSREWGVDPALVLAVVEVESAFDPLARSPAGAMGLMQLMPATARELGVLDPWHPGQNLAGGTRHLARCLQRFGGTALALAAYNAGQERVAAEGAVPPLAETRAYVARVLAREGRYRRLLGSGGAG
jgi:soluble lytic murein transglycosylase